VPTGDYYLWVKIDDNENGAFHDTGGYWGTCGDIGPIVSASVSVTGTAVEASISVAAIPDQLLFDRDGLGNGYIEYNWSMILDVHNNGIDAGDYELRVHNVKEPGESQRWVAADDILDPGNTDHLALKFTSESSASSLCPIQAELQDGDTFVMSVGKSADPELDNIDATSTLYVETYFRDAEGIHRDYWP